MGVRAEEAMVEGEKRSQVRRPRRGRRDSKEVQVEEGEEEEMRP